MCRRARACAGMGARAKDKRCGARLVENGPRRVQGAAGSRRQGPRLSAGLSLCICVGYGQPIFSNGIFYFSPLWLVSWLFALSSAANRKSPTHSPPTPSRSGLSACSAGFGTREAMGCIDWFLSQRTVAQESNPGAGSPGSPGSRARSSRALAPRSRAPGRLRSRAGAPGMAAW